MTEPTNKKKKLGIEAGVEVIASLYRDIFNLEESKPKKYDIRKKNFSPSTSLFSDEAQGQWAPDHQTMIDQYTLKSLFYNEDWIYICVDRIASRISSVPLRVMRISNVDGKEVNEPVPAHPVNAIIDNPNDYQDYTQWIYSVTVDLGVLGNAVQWIQTARKQILPIAGETIRIDLDGSGVIKSYVVTQMSADDVSEFKDVRSIEPEFIAHIKRPNPSSLIWGLSPLIPGQKAMLFNRYSTEYLNNYYVKGALPGLALEIGPEANEKLALRLLRSFEMAYTGRRNQRRNLVLPKGVSAKEISHKLADQQLIDYIQNNRETIINLLQVPKHELSIQTAGSLGSDEYKIALKNFWNGTLKSYMHLISNSLTKKMRDVKWLAANEFLEFDLSQVEALQEDKMQKALLAKEMLQTHTINEIRSELYNLEPATGGDVLILSPPTPLALPSFAPNPALENTNNTGDGVPATTPAPADAAEPDKTLEVDLKPEDDLPMARYQANFEKITNHSKSNNGWWEKRQETAKKSYEHNKEKLAGRTLDLFEKQAVTSIKIAKKYLKEKSAGHLTLKANLIDAKEFEARLRKALEGFTESYVNDFVKILMTEVEMGYDIGLQIPFNIPDKSSVEVLRDKNAEGRRTVLEERGIKTFSQMSETTTNKIMDTVENGVANSKTVDEIVGDMKQALGDSAYNTSRLETIARTETLTASSIGQAAVMKDASTVIPDLKKMWINAGDDRVRGNPGGKFPDSKSDHWSLQGQTVGHDEDFKDEGNGVRLQYPRDTSAPPENSINCFPEGTVFEASEVEKLFRHFYRGPLITVNFKSGGTLSGTPNHPVLTSEGWVALGLLDKGHKVLKTTGFNLLLVSKNSNVYHVKAKANEMFDSAFNSLHAVRQSGSVMDFHGDGSAQDVDVIDVVSRLQDGVQFLGLQKSIDLGLTDSNLGHGLSLSLGGDNQSVSGIGTSHSSISTGDLSQSSFGRETLPLEQLSLTPVSLDDANGFESSTDCNSGDLKMLGDLIDGHTLIEVHVDEVTSVDVQSEFSGQVYNLQDRKQYYTANNYIVHNCRCTFIMVPPEDAESLGLENLDAEGDV